MEATKFGVGAFWFVPRASNYKLEISDDDYVRQLELALCQHSSIDIMSLRISHDKIFTKSVAKKQDWEELIKGGGEYPLPGFFFLRFNITIPREWQEQNTTPLRPGLILDGPLQVVIKSEFYYAVAFVRILNPADSANTDGSEAVYLVRTYLKALFMGNPDLAFVSIGPSPFHADFELREGSFPPQSANDFEKERTPRRGYDVIKFEYNIEKFDGIEDAYDSLVACEIGSQIGLFYFIKAAKIRLSKAWTALERNHQYLVKMSSLDVARRMGKMSAIDRQVQESMISIIDFDLAYKGTTDHIKIILDGDKAKGVTNYLDYFTERAIQEFPVFDSGKFFTFAEFIEGRQSKKWEIGILALAGLIGALIGGVLQRVG